MSIDYTESAELKELNGTHYFTLREPIECGVEPSVKDMDNHQLIKYNPFVSEEVNGKTVTHLMDCKLVEHILGMGYIYNPQDTLWYKLNPNTGIYETNNQIEYNIQYEIQSQINCANPVAETISSGKLNSLLLRIKNTKQPFDLDRELKTKASEPHYEMLVDYLPSPVIDTKLIPVKNGLVNLKTGEIIPHCGLVFTTRCCGVYYRQLSDEELEYESINIIPFFEHIFPDKESIDYFFWWVGMVAFYGKVYPIVLDLYGRGGTGKSSLSNMVAKMLGTESVSVLSLDQFDSRFATSQLEGKSLNIVDESDVDFNGKEKSRISLVKRLTGGNEIQVERKFKDSYKIMNTANLMVEGNSFPSFDSSDLGITRRIRFIKCDTVQDPSINLQEVLSQPSVLNFLFNKARQMWCEYGVRGDLILHQKSKSMRESWVDFRKSNSIYGWVSEKFNGDDDKDIALGLCEMNQTVHELYDEYTLYCDMCYQKPVAMVNFTRKLNGMFGLYVKHSNGMTYFSQCNNDNGKTDYKSGLITEDTASNDYSESFNNENVYNQNFNLEKEEYEWSWDKVQKN